MDLEDKKVLGVGVSGSVVRVDLPGQGSFALKELPCDNNMLFFPKNLKEIYTYRIVAPESPHLVSAKKFSISQDKKCQLWMDIGTPLMFVMMDPAMLQKWQAGNLLLVAHDLACAISALHSRLILHGDIKPGNIILFPSSSSSSSSSSLKGKDPTLHASLSDFGLSTFTESKIHSKGEILFTNGYKAPELDCVGLQDKINLSTDIFALGITLAELVMSWALEGYFRIKFSRNFDRQKYKMDLFFKTTFQSNLDWTTKKEIWNSVCSGGQGLDEEEEEDFDSLPYPLSSQILHPDTATLFGLKNLDRIINWLIQFVGLRPSQLSQEEMSRLYNPQLGPLFWLIYWCVQYSPAVRPNHQAIENYIEKYFPHAFVHANQKCPSSFLRANKNNPLSVLLSQQKGEGKEQQQPLELRLDKKMDFILKSFESFWHSSRTQLVQTIIDASLAWYSEIMRNSDSLPENVTPSSVLAATLLVMTSWLIQNNKLNIDLYKRLSRVVQKQDGVAASISNSMLKIFV